MPIGVETYTSGFAYIWFYPNYLIHYVNEFYGAEILCQKVCKKATAWDQTE